MALGLLCWGVLGQGEECRVDTRFASPNATLATYWEALRSNDAGLAQQCFLEPSQAVPQAGTLWFLPPTEELEVRDVGFVPIEVGHLLARYEVRFRPRGSVDRREFSMSSELLRVRDGWRIVQAAVGEGMPEWSPIPHRVDI